MFSTIETNRFERTDVLFPTFSPAPATSGKPMPRPNWQLHWPDVGLTLSPGHAIKVGLDFIIAVVALLLLSPLLLAIAIYVRSDGGPALYAQTRIGRGGRQFRCLKFRTMVIGAEQKLQEILASDRAAAAEWAATQKLTADPRVNPIGALLRKTSLDELPQLLNVLRGEMSLVGPRPIVAAEMPRYGNDIVFYRAVRPGMTGLWQVSGRSDTSYARRIQLDVDYVRHWSLLKDLAILVWTIPAVLAHRGAV
jgi:undecaprenyl-phosphate galactose phosphotransferase